RRAALPREDDVWTHRQHSFQVDTKRISDASNAACSRRIVTMLDSRHHVRAGAGGERQLSQVRRQAHDAQLPCLVRDLGLRAYADGEGEQKQTVAHHASRPSYVRTIALRRTQSNAGPGSVFLPGATSLCPTTRLGRSAAYVRHKATMRSASLRY